MPNYASTKIFFEGSKTKLQEIEKLLIKPGRYSEYAIDFSYIEGKVPGISDKSVYQLFGCDWEKYVMKEYSTEEFNVFHNKVTKLIKSEKWIGLRDNYINDSSQDVVTQYEDGKLVINVTFNWYCPTLFFAKIAEDFGVNLKVLEFVEGNETFISYVDSEGQCIDLKNSFATIRENETFRNLAIELGLHTPSELAVSLLVSGDEKIVKQLIKNYNIDTDQISFSFNDMQKYAEDGWDIYKSSAFVGLDTESMLDMNKMALMHQFAQLQEKAQKEIKKLS